MSVTTLVAQYEYLQLILFSCVSGVGSAEGFGDTAELFKAINEEDFKKKLEETMEGRYSKQAAESEGNDAEALMNLPMRRYT